MTLDNYILFLSLLLFSATFLIGALILTQERRHELERRTSLVAKSSRTSEPQSATAAGSIAERITRLVQGFFAWRLRNRWGMTAGAPLLVASGVVAGVLVALLLAVLFHLNPILVWIFGIGAFYLLPRQLLKQQQRQVEQKFLNEFPDAIDMIIRMVRAGFPTSVAMRAVATDSPSPIREQFREIADQLEIGMIFQDALVAAEERINLPDFRFFAVATSLQQATGGNIVATLEILSEIIRKRRAARLKARAVTGEVRATAIVLGVLPFVVIGGLLVFAPSYLRPLVEDPRGNAIVGTAIVLMLTGFLAMRRMMSNATRL